MKSRSNVIRICLIISCWCLHSTVMAQQISYQDTTTLSFNDEHVFADAEIDGEWAGSGISKKQLAAGQSGYATTYLVKLKGEKAFGFTENGKKGDWTTIQFGFHFDAKGIVNIVESGKIVKQLNQKPQRGYAYRVWRIKNQVNYHIGKEKVYSSSKKSNKALNVQIGFKDGKGVFSKIKLSKSWRTAGSATLAKNSSSKTSKKTLPDLTEGTILMEKLNFQDVVVIKGLNTNTVDAINKLPLKEEMLYYLGSENTQLILDLVCQHLPWITSIRMPSPKDVKDFSSLSKLTNLEEVYFQGFMPQGFPFDINTLNKNKKLKRLQSLNFQEFKNLELLSNFPQFEYLELGNAKLTRIDFINGLKNLKTLIITGQMNTFDDFTPIGNLTKLEYLEFSSLDNTKDDRLTFLSKVTWLKVFKMHHTLNISNLSFLKNADQLEVFSALGCWHLNDLTALNGKSQLKDVSFYG